jgi:hypothetical protein
VGLEGFRLLGERILDLSPRGMRFACDTSVELGEEVVVSFRAPGEDGPWMHAEAELARIEQGYRPDDQGFAVGLDFRYFERTDRQELLTRLAGLPPPMPRRRIRTVEERVGDGSVLVRGIVEVHTPRITIPRGAFWATAH